MKPESALAPPVVRRRPKLTAGVERILSLFGTDGAQKAATPLGSIPRRLLVAKVHGMGDSVLVRMIIDELLRRNPDMEIGLLTGPGTREIMTTGLDFRVHLYSQKELTARSALALLREIRRAHYEAVLNFEQGSIAGTAFAAATGIPLRIGFIPMDSSPKALFLTHGVRFTESRSMWQSFVALARIADPGLCESRMPLTITSRAETAEWITEWWRTKIGDNTQRAVALHLGCGPGMDFKRWPLEMFIALAEQISLHAPRVTIVLTGTAPEELLIRRFISAYPGRAADASDLGSIDRTAEVLQRCQLLVSNDTGVMHLGAALGVPSVGLFGPTTPRHWAPIGRRVAYVYETKVACSPCVNNYQNRMPSGCANADHVRCMRDITPESVMAAARSVVQAGFLG